MIQQIWLHIVQIGDILGDLIKNSLVAIRFLLEAPILTVAVEQVMPTFIGVAMVHVIAIAVLKAIFMR